MTRIPDAELQRILKRPGYRLRDRELPPVGVGRIERGLPVEEAVTQAPATKAKARSENPADDMNKTEARYLHDYVLPRVKSGEIARWRFDEVRFYLGEKCWYKPDFYLVFADGRIELHEVKGAWIEEDALVKFKAARERYPEFAWKLQQWNANKSGAWRQLAGD